jgi:hypothetical protein
MSRPFSGHIRYRPPCCLGNLCRRDAKCSTGSAPEPIPNHAALSAGQCGLAGEIWY